MFDNIFDNRNKKITNLIKLGNGLSRSLREGVEIFKISDSDRTVSYITENGKIITGIYDDDTYSVLSDIVIESAEKYADDDKFEKHVQTKVSNFVRNLYDDSLVTASTSFNDILESWNDRIKFDKTSKQLHEKNRAFGDDSNIINTPEFAKFIEIAPQVLSFLKENKETISQIPEIKNAVKLSNVVAEAFDTPRINYEHLEEMKEYSVQNKEYSSIYDMICRQELIKKDLLESKRDFEGAWATNEKVRSLAGLIYESDDTVGEVLSEAIQEIPYLAFVSKKQIGNSIRKALSVVEDQVPIPDKDLQQYVAKIFEMKKETRKELTKVLNEKYGVNIQNLKEPLSFKSLINTQVLIFEMLSRLSPKASVQKDVLKDVAIMLKEKNGIQGIDVNDCLNILFENAVYDDFLNEENLIDYIDLGTVASDAQETLVEAGKKKTGASKGDKGKDTKDPEAKDYTDEGDREGDESETHPGKKDYEDDDEDDDKKKKSSKKDKDDDDDDDDEDMEEEKISKDVINKREFLDALSELEDVMQTIGAPENDADLDEGHAAEQLDTEQELSRNLKANKRKEEKDGKKHRNKVVKSALEDAVKRERMRKGPKELGDHDDEV